MPKLKDLEKCKHPNSRKTKALAKQMKKEKSREKSKLAGNIKQNLIGEKLLWFQSHLNSDTVCSEEELNDLILRYLQRFDEELNQIKIKNSIGNRKAKQHASRESVINMTIKREKEEYETCGIEVPDLLNPKQYSLLKSWNGELRFLPNFKLKRYSKLTLNKKKPVDIMDVAN